MLSTQRVFPAFFRSLNITEMAMLSRAVAGVRGRTLIVNLPGSPKGAVECYGFIRRALPHAVALLADKLNVVSKAHEEMVYQDRPRSCCHHSKVRFSFQPATATSARSGINCWQQLATLIALKIGDRCSACPSRRHMRRHAVAKGRD